MSWANPTALWLLAALLLLVFARRRKPRRTLRVANLYLWSAAATRDAPSLARRFRRSLLMLLQAAFIAAVVAAIARPLVSFGGGRVALIVDVSMSMGARHQSTTRLDAAKARVDLLTQELPGASRVRLWSAAATPENRGEFGARDSALMSAVQALHATDAAADLESAIARARLFDPPVSRIYVMTDRPDGAPSRDVEWIRIGEPGENVALTRLVARRRFGSEPFQLLLEATNFGARAASFEAVISQNDSILARRPMQLPPGAEESVVLTLPQTTGVVFARLDAADALAADDGRAAAIPTADPLRVLLINGSHFVAQALATRPGTSVAYATGRSVEDADYDVIVCEGCEAVPANASAVGVLVLPGRSVASREPAPMTVSAIGRVHPIVSLLTLDGLFVAPAAAPAGIDGSRVIAWAAGIPVIVADDDGRRRVVEFRFNPDAGFALESAFPMLIANCLEWLAAPRRSVMTVTAGDLLQLPKRPGQSPEASLPVITGSDGRRVSTSESASAYIAQVDRAGVYRVTTGSETKTLIVNPRVEAESDLRASASPAPANSAPPPTLGTGWDAAGLMLVVALALLAVEWRLKADDRGQTK